MQNGINQTKYDKKKERQKEKKKHLKTISKKFSPNFYLCITKQTPVVFQFVSIMWSGIATVIVCVSNSFAIQNPPKILTVLKLCARFFFLFPFFNCKFSISLDFVSLRPYSFTELGIQYHMDRLLMFISWSSR